MTELDDLDHQLVQALLIDGRAPFSRIAAVLDVSDQTVIRRYRRLRTAGLIRVVGLPVGHRVGLLESWLRLQCTPDAAVAVADALARRPDIAWVTLNSGGTEVNCVTRARTREDRDALLLHKLPRTQRVTAVTAHTVLRVFVGGPSRWLGLDRLTPQQVTALEHVGQPGHGQVQLDATDLALFAALARDGRVGYPELARATGLSESTARRRLEHLHDTGALFFDVEIDPALLGFPTQATLWATVAPADLPAAGAALAAHPGVPFAAAVTGSANLVAVVLCRDTDELYEFLTGKVGSLPAIQKVELTPVIRTVKRAGLLTDGHRLVDPAE
ncbi:DNA-binding Lrp family transcriptional regulator [Kitasatospora sp. MAA4]|uniref:Lrp/AsnC family transcriptional regulator n=1 Tax=Kitasatospora sp. MAA4 TaxID=3035093 RepID=UPI002476C80A|nr:AsnC family transcriptional regulator [Kitasatospora sp. MAA4]MDH6135409.1 DNA-binding Lrp family transcriptional regulator [Kitasatospora sp. MAA4]